MTYTIIVEYIDTVYTTKKYKAERHTYLEYGVLISYDSMTNIFVPYSQIRNMSIEYDRD